MPYGTVNAEQMTTQSGFTLGAGNASSFKNRIINGAMVIAQRGTGTTSNTFVNQVDQFQVASNSSATFTFGQSSTAPTGFIKSALNTNTSAITLTGTNYYQIRNVIEGLNIADLGWGTANAKAVTLSFWVYSSLTGSFGGSIFNGSANYSYPFLYTVSSANTWTQISVSIAGPTAGTWATDNGTGMFIEWSLGCGSTYLGTAGAWAASRFQGATGQVQLSQTNGATFYITGAQLEVGTVATSFDFRPYGAELMLCQRYCCVLTSGGGNAGPYGGLYASAAGRVWYKHPVTMRASPTLSGTSGTGTASLVGVGTANCTVANTFFLPEISTWDLTSLSTSSTLGLPLVYIGAGILSAEL